MSYSEALEAAGAIVHEYRQFGSYQGVWIAVVTDPDGITGMIRDYYGSCSGCDAYEATCGTMYCYDDYKEDHDQTTCETCIAVKAALKDFGAKYLSCVQSPESLAEYYLEDSYWSDYSEDADQARMVLEYLDKGTDIYKKLKTKIDSYGNED